VALESYSPADDRKLALCFPWQSSELATGLSDRNIVKADNWMESVQKVMDDPQFEGWFVKFDQASPRS
jgi:hypothetical protein